MKDPSKPYSPGARSSKLDEVTSLAWNRQVQYVLVSSSTTGYTVVWDLRNKREVVALAYGGATQGLNIMGAGGRKGMSDVAWHPDNVSKCTFLYCANRLAHASSGNQACHVI